MNLKEAFDIIKQSINCNKVKEVSGNMNLYEVDVKNKTYIVQINKNGEFKILLEKNKKPHQ